MSRISTAAASSELEGDRYAHDMDRSFLNDMERLIHNLVPWLEHLLAELGECAVCSRVPGASGAGRCVSSAVSL